MTTRPKQIVLDPFAGSGSTLLAAKHLDRHCIGFEISPEFCKLAADRLSKTAPVISPMQRGPQAGQSSGSSPDIVIKNGTYYTPL
jgi:DNA modification methylase